jgi:hypothetical protein
MQENYTPYIKKMEGVYHKNILILKMYFEWGSNGITFEMQIIYFWTIYGQFFLKLRIALINW